MKPHKLLLLTVACTWALGASAQWQWLDKDGRKVFSDRPPPMEIPQKSILKEPGGGKVSSRAAPALATGGDAAPGTTQGTAPAAPASGASGAGAPAPTATSGKDAQMEEAKAKAEAAEAAKKKAEADRLAKARTENCTRARKSKDMLTSGQLLANVNDKGERGFMDDATRESELKRAEGVIASDCK